MFARRGILTLLRASKTGVRCHATGCSAIASRADLAVAKYLTSRSAPIAALSGLTAGIGLQLINHTQAPSACDSMLHQSALVAQRDAAYLPAEKDTVVANSEEQPSSFLVLLRCARRTAYLLLVFGPLLLFYPLSRWQWTEELWWRWCVSSFETSGALLIKLAQWASSRPDMFGERICSRFNHLQDNTPLHAWEETALSLDRMFGTSWPEHLELERTPIGSGCIAQVYRGRVRQPAADAGASDEWRAVAVKVLHPGVAEHIDVDMRLLFALGRLLSTSPTLKWLNPLSMLSEFASMLTSQLDLTVEADNLARFRRNFPPPPDGNGKALVVFPEPIHPLVSRDVLVESFIDGRPFLEWAAELPADSPKRSQICNEGTDVYVQMVFVHNLVHGDLHPGNIFVVDHAASGEAQLAYLDAGIAVSYSDADHEHLIDVLSAFIRYDGYEAGRLMASHSSEADQLVDVDGFCAKIQTLVQLIRISPTLIDQIGHCLSIICEAACEHRVKMQGGFMSIALTMKVVEGSIIQVDPHTKVAPRAKPVVLRESARRKGRALLNRTLGAGEQTDDTARAAEDKLIADAKRRAIERGYFDMMDEYRKIRRGNLERSSLEEKVASVDNVR